MSDTDINYRSLADQIGVSLNGIQFTPADPGKWDDILKISACRVVAVRHCTIAGGSLEDAVDIMRGSTDVTVDNCEVGCGRYAFTIKGGSDRIFLTDVLIIGKGRAPENVEIDIGNYSQTVPDAKTGTVILDNVRRDDGRPVRVRVGWAERPIVRGGNVRILFWQSLGLKLYVWFKRKFRR